MAQIVRPGWMSEEMYLEWFDYYIEAGGETVPESSTRATELFRQSPNYESYFPGIKREDGSVRYTTNPEQTYQANIEAFRNTVSGLGMNADVFGPEYIDLISGDTSPDEFTTRANALEARVMSQGAGIRDWYSDNLGIDMTREGILASLMSDRVETAVLERRITMAEIGGEAVSRDFDISTEFVEMLTQYGMDRADAQQQFGTAERLLPVLQNLAARHGDVDDSFDLTELIGGTFLDDAEQVNRLTRLTAQEASTFTGGAALDVVRARTGQGGVTGLLDV